MFETFVNFIPRKRY